MAKMRRSSRGKRASRYRLTDYDCRKTSPCGTTLLEKCTHAHSGCCCCFCWLRALFLFHSSCWLYNTTNNSWHFFFASSQLVSFLPRDTGSKTLFASNSVRRCNLPETVSSLLAIRPGEWMHHFFSGSAGIPARVPAIFCTKLL